jgi:hypothetical protein
VPGDGRAQNHSSFLDLFAEVLPEPANVHRFRLESDQDAGALVKGEAGESAQVDADVDQDVPLSEHHRLVVVSPLLELFGSRKRKSREARQVNQASRTG